MPCKGSSLQVGPRYNPINKQTWETFKLESSIDISYDKWVEIIRACNLQYATQVTNNAMGVKFPEAMGHLGTTRYKAKAGTRRVDWKKSKELGTRVYHTNFHSEGYETRIVWLTDPMSSCKYLSIYKLVPDRALSRAAARLTKEGKVYNTLNHEHFRMGKIRVNIKRLNGR